MHEDRRHVFAEAADPQRAFEEVCAGIQGGAEILTGYPA